MRRTSCPLTECRPGLQVRRFSPTSCTQAFENTRVSECARLLLKFHTPDIFLQKSISPVLTANVERKAVVGISVTSFLSQPLTPLALPGSTACQSYLLSLISALLPSGVFRSVRSISAPASEAGVKTDARRVDASLQPFGTAVSTVNGPCSADSTTGRQPRTHGPALRAQRAARNAGL